MTYKGSDKSLHFDPERSSFQNEHQSGSQIQLKIGSLSTEPLEVNSLNNKESNGSIHFSFEVKWVTFLKKVLIPAVNVIVGKILRLLPIS